MNLSEFSNLAVALATGALALVTFVTNRRMKEQFDSLNRPYVRANLVISGHSAISLQVSNEGSAPAENLTMKLDRDFRLNGEESMGLLNSASAFSRPVKAMPAKTSWNYFLGVGHRLLDATRCPQEFNISVRYESKGRAFEEILQIDLDALRGTGTVTGEDPQRDALKSIATSAAAISRHLQSGDHQQKG